MGLFDEILLTNSDNVFSFEERANRKYIPALRCCVMVRHSLLESPSSLFFQDNMCMSVDTNFPSASSVKYKLGGPSEVWVPRRVLSSTSHRSLHDMQTVRQMNLPNKKDQLVCFRKPAVGNKNAFHARRMCVVQGMMLDLFGAGSGSPRTADRDRDGKQSSDSVIFVVSRALDQVASEVAAQRKVVRRYGSCTLKSHCCHFPVCSCCCHCFLSYWFSAALSKGNSFGPI